MKKLYEGLPVRVRIDALPGQIFMGKVSKIAPLPDAQSIFMNPDLKLYNTIVAIEGGAGVLKSGMNCEAEVVIEQYEKAMYEYMDMHHADILDTIRSTGKFEKDTEEKLASALKQFTQDFLGK